jgi:hypothetical protein
MSKKKKVIITGTYDVVVKKDFAIQINEDDINWRAYILGNILCATKSEYDLWKGYGSWNPDLFEFTDSVVKNSMHVNEIYIVKSKAMEKFIPQTLSISDHQNYVQIFEKLFD